MKNEWYQCTDNLNSWSRDKHQSYRDAGSFPLSSILADPSNQHAVLIGHNTLSKRFVIQDGKMVPLPNRI